MAMAAAKRLNHAGYADHEGGWLSGRRVLLVWPRGAGRTPPAVLAKLEKALADVLAVPDVRKRLTEWARSSSH